MICKGMDDKIDKSDSEDKDTNIREIKQCQLGLHNSLPEEISISCIILFVIASQLIWMHPTTTRFDYRFVDTKWSVKQRKRCLSPVAAVYVWRGKVQGITSQTSNHT